MEILGHIFYFFGLLIFLINIQSIPKLFEYIKIREWFKSYKKVTKKIPTDKDFKKGEFDKYNNYNGIISLNFFWLFLGILSNSWKIFLIVLLISILIDSIVYVVGEFNTLSKLLSVMKIIFITSSVIVLTINHFHLHLDLFSLLVGFFS